MSVLAMSVAAVSALASPRVRAQLGVLSLGALLAATVTTPAAAQTGQVSPNTARLTVDELLREMAEPDARRSDAIDMYLLGIFDVTEGSVWCDYRRFKLDTLRSEVFSSLRALPDETLQQPAAPMVSAVLAQRFPCQR